MGSDAVAVTDVTDRFRVDLLVARSHRLQERDPDVLAEQQQWLDRHRGDGVPTATCPTGPHPTEPPSRFDEGLARGQRSGGRDQRRRHPAVRRRRLPGSWLRAGESLSALWLRAVRDGLSVVPLSQVVEVAETRDALQHQVLGGLVVPLLLVRVGWQAISRSHLEPTPRRPLDDVLLP